jgi:hypothetical protein
MQQRTQTRRRQQRRCFFFPFLTVLVLACAAGQLLVLQVACGKRTSLLVSVSLYVCPEPVLVLKDSFKV